MNRILRWLFFLAVVAGIAAAIFFAVQPKPVPVDLATISRGPMQVTVNEDGKTRIRDRYVVSTPLSGRLLRIEIDPGDPVKLATTRLAVITPRDPGLLDTRELRQAEMRVKAEEAALAQATPAVERAKAALNFAESDLARTRKNVPSRAVTLEEFDRAKMEYRVRQEDYRSAVFAERIARYEWELAKAALIRTRSDDRDNVSDFEIFSPIHGRVLRVFQESSTVVSAGTSLLEVGDPTDLEVVVDVLSSDAVKVSAGAPVLLERWGGDAPLHGKVRLVEPSAFTKISSLGVEEQRVNVIIDIEDASEKRGSLGDGFRVEARIVIWENDDVVKVSHGALFRDMNEWSAFVVQDNVATLRRLTIGQQNELEAEVLEGLAPDDQVILHPGNKIKEGMEIIPR